MVVGIGAAPPNTLTVSVEFTEDTEETVLLESELISEWKPKTNLKMNPEKS